MYWHLLYLLYVPIYLFYLFIAAASVVGMYLPRRKSRFISLESIELETESRYEDKKSGDQIIGQ